MSEPGFIPPVKAGMAAATGDVIAVMDDDAEAEDGWAARLLRQLRRASIGAVGGRYINTSDETGPTPVPDTDRVGYVNGVGQFVGRMYCRPTFSQPVEVDFLIGGNMSFRREVAARLEFDMELNRNVAQGYEVDIGLQVRRLGWKIIFDPRLAIRHYSAPARDRRACGRSTRRASSGTRSTSCASACVVCRCRASRSRCSTNSPSASGPAPGFLPLVLAPIARRVRVRHPSCARGAEGPPARRT